MILTYRTRNGDVENAFGMGKVFVSYKKPRIRLCKRVTEDILNSVNCAVWYDRNLTPGAQYNDEIAAAIDEANAFVLLVGYETFDEEGYVMKKELPRALERRIPIIPVVIDNDEELIKKADKLLEQRHMLKMSEPEEYMRELERVLKDTILSEDEQENVIKAFAQDSESLGKTEYFRGVGYLKGLNTDEKVIERDPDRALSLLRSSAENYGYVDAMLLIADMYNDGNGVQRSVDEALSWLDKAIEKQSKADELKLDEACQLDKTLKKKGEILSYLGRYTEAAAAHEARLTMWREYKDDEPEAQSNHADACKMLGDIYLSHFSQIENAKLLFCEFLAITEKLAEASPDFSRAQRNLSISYEKLGDVCVTQGDLPGAKDYYQKALEISQKLAEASPDSAEAQRDLSVSYEKLGNVCMKQGDLPGARDYHQNALEISQKLAKASPDSAKAQRDLSVSYEKLGDVCVKQGELPGAKDYYQKALEISQKLAEASPDSAQAQRDLLVSYEKLGDVCMTQGDLPGAREYYQKSIEISQKLAEASPDSAETQRTLSVSYNKLGDVCVEQGDLPGAREYYQNCLEIRQKLAESSPDSAEVQRDLSVSYEKLGNVCEQQGNLTVAMDYYQNGLEISRKLAKISPDSAQAQDDLAISYYKVGENTRNVEMLEKAAKVWSALYEKTGITMYKERTNIAEAYISLLQSADGAKASATEEHADEPQNEAVTESVSPTPQPENAVGTSEDTQPARNRRSLWWLWLLAVLAALAAVGFGLDYFNLIDFSELLSLLN